MNKEEKLITQEALSLPKKDRGRYLREVEDYILNLCPKHPLHSERYKCESCQEECKYK